MKAKFILLLILFALTGSCKKITHVTLIEPAKPGKLSYQIVDDEGKGVSGVKVHLYDAMSKAKTIPANSLAQSRTNQEGVAGFTDLLPGNYQVVSDSAVVNGLMYALSEYIQILSDVEKRKTVKASDFSGTLTVKLLAQNRETPLANMGLLAFEAEKRPSADKIKSFIASALLKGVTDKNGMASIKVPSNRLYSIIVYSLTTGNGVIKSGNYLVEKGEETYAPVYHEQ